MGKQWKQWQTLFSWAPKSLQLVTAALKLNPLSLWKKSYGQFQFSWVKLFISVPLFAIPWTAACQASLSITSSWSLLKLMPIKSVMPSNHLILSHPPLPPPSSFPSIRVFSNESVLCIRWQSFSIIPSSEYSELVSFRIDWFDLLAVQGILKSLLQHHNLNISILQYAIFLRSNSHIHTWLLEKQ